jgi:sterol desaturase/sphingolipid hydroxylase (fatty acid hydroxylase superfamily)
MARRPFALSWGAKGFGVYLVLGTIVIAVLMTWELWYGRALGRRLYGFGDTIVNLSAIAIEQVFMALAAAPAYALYMAARQRSLVGELPPWVSFPLAIVLVDLAFYAWHRLSHRVSILWFGHAVHHSSEEFNVSVAIRASGWALLTQRFFFLPMALFGVPVDAVLLGDAVGNLWALLVHNRVVDKLGPLERVFNTPSHHRVHHGRNPEYLDKNYGGVFIVWDRLFGTYAEEVAPPVFGLRLPLRTHNVVWARFHVAFEIADRVRRTPGLWGKLRAPFRPPEWDPAGAHDVTSPAVPSAPISPAASRPMLVYAVAQHGLLFAAATAFVARYDSIDPDLRLPMGVWLWASFGIVGGLLDARRWALSAEAGRWVLAVALVAAVRPAW